MGSNHSNLPPRPIGFAYMCITIRDSDTLSIILGSDHEASIIRQIIQETWPKGMQKETFELNGVYKFRLKGSPFSPLSSSSKAISCRRMAERILNRLYQLGWKLQMTSNLSQELDLATWIFKKVPVPEFTPPPFLVVGLSNLDSLMILNAPSQLHQVFKDAIEESWPSGIQNWTVDNELLSIKLKGKPWLPGGEDTVHSRVMLQAIISNLTTKQWNLYGNSNIRADSNTFFFEHNPSMVPCELPHPPHFIITFNRNDVLRVIGLPESLVPVIQSTIQSAWSKGIEKESHYAGSYQFKLKGCPWWASGNEAVESRFLVMKLMEVLLAHGWSPITAFDSSRKWCDKRSLLFRQTQPQNTPFFCLSPYFNDKLRFINAPEDVIKVCYDKVRGSSINVWVTKCPPKNRLLSFSVL